MRNATESSGEAAWYRQLLDDAEEEANKKSPRKASGSCESRSPSQSTQALARELAVACAALGREVAKLHSNVRWAGAVIDSVEAAGLQESKQHKHEGPGVDSWLSQLLASAEEADRAARQENESRSRSLY